LIGILSSTEVTKLFILNDSKLAGNLNKKASPVKKINRAC